MTQMILPPHNRTDTSIAAAIAVAPKVGSQKWAILHHLEWFGGETQDEIALATGFLRSAVCARVNELVRDGWVRDSGVRRLTRYGHKAIVWELVTERARLTERPRP